MVVMETAQGAVSYSPRVSTRSASECPPHGVVRPEETEREGEYLGSSAREEPGSGKVPSHNPFLKLKSHKEGQPSIERESTSRSPSEKRILQKERNKLLGQLVAGYIATQK